VNQVAKSAVCFRQCVESGILVEKSLLQHIAADFRQDCRTDIDLRLGQLDFHQEHCYEFTNEHKTKRLMQDWPQGTAAVTAWFERLGISRQLLNRYHHSGWITRLGTGAYEKTGDDVNWHGGLHALQIQAGLPIHVGAMTALSMQGLAHHLRLG